MTRKPLKWGFFLFCANAATAFAQQAIDIKRERGGTTAAAKDALEGTVPPELTASMWLNTDGKALTWKGLKGNIVILDFWAHW